MTKSKIKTTETIKKSKTKTTKTIKKSKTKTTEPIKKSKTKTTEPIKFSPDLEKVFEAVKIYVKTIPSSERMKVRYELYQFAKYIGFERKINTLTPPEIGDYGDLLSSRIAVSETYDRMDTVKKFLLFLTENELVDENLNLPSHMRTRRSYKSKISKNTIMNLRLPSQPTLTRSRHVALTKRLNVLLKERNRLAETIQIAAQDKDVRENAPLEAAREAQGLNTTKINEIESMLRGAVIVADEKGKFKKGTIALGSNVTVENQNNKLKSKYKIVDPSESDPLSSKISSESPLSKSIMGKTQEEIVTVKAPNGITIEYKILKVV